MENRKEDNCWIDFLKPVNRKEAKYPLSKREGMDSGAQAKGLPLAWNMDSSSIFNRTKNCYQIPKSRFMCPIYTVNQSPVHWVWSRKSFIRRAAQREGRGPFPNLPYLIRPRERLYTIDKETWELGQKLEDIETSWDYALISSSWHHSGNPGVVHVVAQVLSTTILPSQPPPPLVL